MAERNQGGRGVHALDTLGIKDNERKACDAYRHRLQVGMRWGGSFERGNSRVQDVAASSRVVRVRYLATGISSHQTVEKRGDMYTF